MTESLLRGLFEGVGQLGNTLSTSPSEPLGLLLCPEMWRDEVIDFLKPTPNTFYDTEIHSYGTSIELVIRPNPNYKNVVVLAFMEAEDIILLSNFFMNLVTDSDMVAKIIKDRCLHVTLKIPWGRGELIRNFRLDSALYEQVRQ